MSSPFMSRRMFIGLQSFLEAYVKRLTGMPATLQSVLNMFLHLPDYLTCFSV